MILYRASWIVSIDRPVFRDGAVAVSDNRIIEVGRFSDLRGKYSDFVIQDYGDCVLLPPLVNAHTHLELSYLEQLGKKEKITLFTTWIEGLLEARNSIKITKDELIDAGRKMLASMENSGIGVVADIGNAGFANLIGSEFKGSFYFFHEKLGLSAAAAKRIVRALENDSISKYVTAHAPYSSHPDLIVSLKQRAAKQGHPFSIHVAETESEITFLRTGKGEFPAFYKKHGFWDDSFRLPGIDINGSVQYLDNLGVLDEQTLCVHAIHVSEQEIQLLAERGAKVCLCPGSNRFLGVGVAPAGDYLRNKILPALGTDSAASNPRLSIWREMRILCEDHPDIPPEDILAMATLGGAQSFGIAHEYGSLSVGKNSAMLAIPVSSSSRQDEILEFLVTGDTVIKPQWIR